MAAVNQEVVDRLQGFFDEVETLREFAYELGLNDDQVDQCICETLKKEKPSAEKLEKRLISRYLWCWVRLVKYCVYGGAICLAVFLSVYALTCYHAPSNNSVMRVLAPHGYTVAWAIRKATLPIARRWKITEYYNSDCVVDNPFYAEPRMECEGCVDMLQAVDMTGKMTPEVYRDGGFEAGIPFKLTDAVPHLVGFASLQDLYVEEKEVLDESVELFFSNDVEVASPEGLFNLTCIQAHAKYNLHVHWSSNQVEACPVLRRLFPRPYFIPQRSEVHIEKIILIDGAKAKPYELPRTHFINNWVAQTSGSRRYYIYPYPDCRQMCKSMQVTLEAGEMLFYNNQVHTVDSVANGDQMSVVFVGTFM